MCGSPIQHSQIKGWQQHNAPNLSTNNPFMTCIPFPGWQDPNESQKPVPPTWTVGEGALPPRETTQIQKLHSGKGRRVRGSHECAALRDPLANAAPAKLCWNAAPLWLKVKNRHTDTPKHLFHQHSFLPDPVSGRQLFPRESWWLSDPPKGTTGAPTAATHSLAGPSAPHRHTAMGQRSLPKSVTGRIF